jgi:hypothetical protein
VGDALYGCLGGVMVAFGLGVVVKLWLDPWLGANAIAVAAITSTSTTPAAVRICRFVTPSFHLRQLTRSVDDPRLDTSLATLEST